MITELNEMETVGLIKQLRVMQGSLFEKHLKCLQKKTDEELRHITGDGVLRHQGRAQLLEELLENISSARTELEKLEKPKVDMNKAF